MKRIEQQQKFIAKEIRTDQADREINATTKLGFLAQMAAYIDRTTHTHVNKRIQFLGNTSQKFSKAMNSFKSPEEIRGKQNQLLNERYEANKEEHARLNKVKRSNDIEKKKKGGKK